MGPTNKGIDLTTHILEIHREVGQNTGRLEALQESQNVTAEKVSRIEQILVPRLAVVETQLDSTKLKVLELETKASALKVGAGQVKVAWIGALTSVLLSLLGLAAGYLGWLGK